MASLSPSSCSRCRRTWTKSSARFIIIRCSEVGESTEVASPGGRAPERDRYLPLHGHRGLDGPAQAAGPRPLRRGSRRAAASPACGLRSPSGAGGGRTGDSFFVAFRTAAAAVAAAVAFCAKAGRPLAIPRLKGGSPMTRVVIGIALRRAVESPAHGLRSTETVIVPATPKRTRY